MSTNSRSRKSSITSRLPPSLRIPSIKRQPSNTQLSIIFASGDSTKSSALSEDHLSKQLDGDSGCKQMGLRSRRSSSATIRTIKTVSGLKSPSSDHTSFIEQDEDEIEKGNRNRINDSPEPIAGPSTLPQPDPLPGDELSIKRESSPNPTINKRSLNPKNSSTWLKWTSPTPSFPRSTSVNKGKGKEKQLDSVQNGEAANNLDINNSTETSHATIPRPVPSLLPAQASEPVPTPPPPPPTIKPPDLDTSTNPSLSTSQPKLEPTPDTSARPSSPKSRGWWGRSTSAQQPAKIKQAPKSDDRPIVDSPALASSSAQPTKVEISNPPITTPMPSTDKPPFSPTVAPSLPPPAETTPVSSVSIAPAAVDPTSSFAKPLPAINQSANQGWKAYLGWRSDGKEIKKVEESTNVSNSTVDPVEPELPPQEGVPNVDPTSDMMDIVTESPLSSPKLSEETTAPPDSATNDSIAPQPTTPTQPWSSYLYSFVVPPPRQQPTTPSHSAHGQPVEPTDPTEDQKPVHTESPPDVSIREATPVPEPQPESKAATSSSNATSPPRNTDRRPSTTGWLNYLALRANQKKITASSLGTSEGDAKNGEEVMDFSTDPDFPSSVPTQSLAPAQARNKDVRVSAESIRSITPKPSQNLDVRKKRLSNASLISNGSLATTPASPKPRSSLDSNRPTSTNQSGSALPHPQPPSIQPNLVIPTFNDTFDRPPRSFLPVPIPQVVEEPTKSITATTTGLAWKAFGAVGSYVYGGVEANQKITSESILEDDKELRGRKEGRNVGAELPRRIGLGSGSPDDGWKNVKRVVVVGVHGWFPAKMLNSVIGEPTGTSVKFANMMGQAVQQFFHEKGVDDIRLTLMPLEGEGTIESRVDRLFKAYLSNPAWINDLRRADAIFFAAHSQGCIVTTHLISRMIAQGHIRTPLNQEAVGRCEWGFGPIGVVPPEDSRKGKRGSTNIQGSEGGYQQVAMLAMCGVHLGPLYSISTSTVIQPYLQWFENAAARELFEFQDSTSAVSIAYQKALSMVLENEVRVVLLASLNDQVVPIYGASFSTATHPLLLRALYVDGASYTQSDFMTNLLCFAFMLRNAGIDDQRLVEHLSEATAGSLTGVGHSTPYEELSCYSIAVQYLFHSGSARHPITPLEIEPFSARDAKNDFELPWIMRALVDSPEIKDLFPGELKDLKEGILNWRPTTKVLKDIKKRLEPMAGRQSRLRALHTSPSSTSLISNNDQNLGVSPGTNKNLVSGLRKDW